MTVRNPSAFAQRVNYRLPANVSFYSGAEAGGIIRNVISGLIAMDTIASAGTFLTGQSIASAGNTSTFNAAYTAAPTQMGPFGRCTQVVASGAATSTVIIRGRDYLGQLVREDFTLNGTTAVLGKKSFRYVDNIEWTATAATTINVGLSNGIGLQYKFADVVSEIKGGIAAANAGAFATGSATVAQTAITTDPRGRYTPVTVLPDGSLQFEIAYIPDMAVLHGLPHFYS